VFFFHIGGVRRIGFSGMRGQKYDMDLDKLDTGGPSSDLVSVSRLGDTTARRAFWFLVEAENVCRKWYRGILFAFTHAGLIDFCTLGKEPSP